MMATETHTNRAVIHKEGHAQSRRGGVGSLFHSYFSFHHPVSERDEATLGKEGAYKRPEDSSVSTLPLMRGRKKEKRGFNNVTKFTGEQLGGVEGCPSEVFVATRCL